MLKPDLKDLEKVLCFIFASHAPEGGGLAALSTSVPEGYTPQTLVSPPPTGDSCVGFALVLLGSPNIDVHRMCLDLEARHDG